MPSITTWTRLEPRSRSADLMAGLEARVHDPLWLLARQWQVGEFEGRNTGSPVAATVAATTAQLDRFSVAGKTPQVYDRQKPLEVLVEQETARPSNASGDYRQAVEAGLYLLRLLSAAKTPAAIPALYLAQYPLPRAAGDAQTISSIAAGRVIDGVKLYADLLAAGSDLPALPAIPADQHAAVLAVTRSWLAWYGGLFSEPADVDGWSNDRMEYSFAMSAAASTDSYAAQEYDGGAVDWYTFDRSAKPLAGGTAQPPPGLTVVVSPVTFRGMPARRFWDMEDASTDIAELSAAAEDIGRILLREFALVYANDWFQFPLTIPIGSQVDITSLTVLDTFGWQTAIPHYSTVDGPLAKWRLFNVSPDQSAAPALSTAVQTHPLLLTAGAVGPIDGPSIEEVLMLRDELANVAWGIERRVLGVSGQSFDRTTQWNKDLPAAPLPSGDTPPKYRLGSDVPDYWLPYFPVPGTGSKKPLKLQLGKLPTASTGPLGEFLGAMKVLFLDEVPREGVLLERYYRFARGLDGSACLWIGRERSTGKGEGRSGLRFDFLE